MWPVLFEWDGAKIYAYPLFMGLAWGLGYRLSEARLPPAIPHRHFVFWFIGVFLSSWVGAKLLFMATQETFNVIDLATASSFWLGGGFVFLGGFLGSLLFIGLVSVFSSTLTMGRMQFTIVPLLWAHAIGRIGCLLAGCCYGQESELPWAINLHGHARHPVQIYEALALASFAFWLGRKEGKRHFLSFYLVGYGVIRWALEWLRGDEIRGLWGAMSTSQWVAIGMFVVGGALYFLRVRPQDRAV